MTTSQLFSSRYRRELRELFALLGVPFSEEDPRANAVNAHSRWMTEHRKLNTEYPRETLLGVLPLGERMGMLGESLPTMHEPRSTG